MTSKVSRVLVYGGAGALGRSILERFHLSGWTTYSADIASFSASYINHSFHINSSNKNQTSASESEETINSVSNFLNDSLPISDPSLDCIVCTAGGFTMDTIASNDFYEQLDRMWKWNTLSAFHCSSIASKYLSHSSSHSLLVLTGAAAALTSTPIMLSYGISKVAVHHLIRSLADNCDGEVLPKTTKCIGIVPVTIDTPGNRTAMSDANFDNWTKCNEFAEQILEWAVGDGTDVVNGGLYQFNTENNKTSISGGYKLKCSIE